MKTTLKILRKHWGYESLRPLQEEAMRAVVGGRDSLVVLPTGGGKSLCFQVPAVQMPGMAVVVSPLISLMKDQVDALTDCGVAAASANSTQSASERHRIAEEVRQGRLKLLYLSPERLMTERTIQFLQQSQLSFIAIDEAHCISDWGHDFRPEYRSLQRLREHFPGVALHAYTATATERVRNDIVRHLLLRDPEVLVGSFDRPNLVYRLAQRTDLMQQIGEVLQRHPGDSGIIYCIRRADVEEISAGLNAAGHRAVPYHAGMPDDDRRRNQDAFINDRAKIIVATVAFGMGIDKSDVRYVIHAGAPKSLESYQQESGRAGRDGLEAECCLFYSARDFQTWRRLQGELAPAAVEAATALLTGIEGFCVSVQCRHRSILNYFGEATPEGSCNACDFCLEELEFADDALVIGQKILSCVLRLGQSYGAGYTSQVLIGSRDQRITEQGHHSLSTFGILAGHKPGVVRAWIEQLVGQGYLEKIGEYPILKLTLAARAVLRGETVPQLLQSAKRPRREARVARESWEGVDRELFEALRTWRRQKAEERGIAPFIVFGDATLRDLARRRPSTTDELLAVHGIGEKKCAEYGAELITQLADYCQSR